MPIVCKVCGSWYSPSAQAPACPVCAKRNRRKPARGDPYGPCVRPCTHSFCVQLREGRLRQIAQEVVT